MKRFSQPVGVLIIMLLFLSVGLFTSCTQDQAEELPEDYNSLELIVTEIGKQAQQEGKIITFDLVVDGNSFRKENVQVIQDSKFVLGFMEGYDGKPHTRGNSVDITCMYPDGSETTTTCSVNNSICIGDAVSTCLNGGGCAILCLISITYFPNDLK